MITFLISKFISLGLSQTWARIAVIASAVVLIFVACVGLKACYDSRIISQHDQKVNIEVLQKQAPANDKAANARASDTIRLDREDKERHDAIAQATDESPTDADIALNCKRLQQSGYDTSAFPSCS